MLFLLTTLAVLLAGTNATAAVGGPAVAVGDRVKLQKCDVMEKKYPFQGKILHFGRIYRVPITWNAVLEPFCDKCFKVKTFDQETGTLGLDCTTTPTAICTKQRGTLYFRNTMIVPGGEKCLFDAEKVPVCGNEVMGKLAPTLSPKCQQVLMAAVGAPDDVLTPAECECFLTMTPEEYEKITGVDRNSCGTNGMTSMFEDWSECKAKEPKEPKKMCSDYNGDKKGCRQNSQGYQEGAICKYKGEKCKSFSCGDMPQKPIKCGKKGKQLGLTCFYNPKAKTCGAAKPEGITCADYAGDKKACKKESKAVGLKCKVGKKADKGKCLA